MATTNGGGHGWRNGRTLTIRDLGRMIIEDYIVNGRRTTARVRQAFDLHLIPFYAEIPAEDMGFMSPAYIQHRISQGAARATIRNELMNLGKSHSIAVRAGMLEYKPRLSVPSVFNTRGFLIPAGQVDQIQGHLPGYARDLVEGLYLTGWRASELLRLRWDNVDEINSVIRLEPARGKVGPGRVFPYGNFPRLRLWIRNRKRKTVDAEMRSGKKVLTVIHRDGEPIRGIRRPWRRACGENHYWVHDLRRSAVSNMVNARIPIHVVMELIGHKTRSMVDRYHIVTMEDKQAGVLQYATYLESVHARIGL